MKKLFFLFLAIPFFSIAQDGHLSGNWQTDYDTAMKMAQDQDQNILLYFTGSDWCGPCKHLKHDFFETQQFQDLSQNMVLLCVDIPRNVDLVGEEQYEKNKALLPKWNKQGVFPLVRVLSPKGKSLAQISGYGMDGDASRYFRFLEKNNN